jgi:hypothetical protein
LPQDQGRWLLILVCLRNLLVVVGHAWGDHWALWM